MNVFEEHEEVKYFVGRKPFFWWIFIENKSHATWYSISCRRYFHEGISYGVLKIQRFSQSIGLSVVCTYISFTMKTKYLQANSHGPFVSVTLYRVFNSKYRIKLTELPLKTSSLFSLVAAVREVLHRRHPRARWGASVLWTDGRYLSVQWSFVYSSDLCYASVRSRI